MCVPLAVSSLYESVCAAQRRRTAQVLPACLPDCLLGVLWSSFFFFWPVDPRLQLEAPTEYAK